MKKSIFEQKNQTSLFKGVMWSEFIDNIFTHFLPTFIRPIRLEYQSKTLMDSLVANYGKGSAHWGFENNLNDLVQMYKTLPDPKILSISIRDKGRNFKTVLPPLVAVAFIERLEKEICVLTEKN